MLLRQADIATLISLSPLRFKAPAPVQFLKDSIDILKTWQLQMASGFPDSVNNKGNQLTSFEKHTRCHTWNPLRVQKQLTNMFL